MTKEEKKEYNKAYREKNRERLKEYQKEYDKAYREKNKERIKERKKAYYQNNKERIKEYKKAYNKANTGKKKEYDKVYREKNKERIKAYYKANREEINEKKKAYYKERRKKDPLFRLKKNLRDASWKAWKGTTKNATTEKLLGCSYNDFKDYIECQFVGNMSWDNYGDVWHVDHIIPLAVIEDVAQEELISSLCHYSNLQPLFACHNLSKNDKLDYEYPAIYKTNLLHNSNKK